MDVNFKRRCARQRGPSSLLHITPLWQILVRLGLLACALLPAASVGHAQDDEFWDEPFAEPLYLVHITETSTMYGPVKKDVYILYPQEPENGVLLTADGSGGYFINQAESAGGPFHTRRQVCANVQGIPEEKLSLGFSCGALTGPGSCTGDCQQMHGPNSEGTIVDGRCSCSCRDGYEPDDSLFCVPTKAHCDQSCREYHGTDKNHGPQAYGRVEDGVCNCYCQKGYVPDETLTCVKEKSCQQECEDRWGQNVEGRGQYPACQCECKKGYDRSLSTSSCLESCAAQCKKQYGWQASGSGDPAQPCNCYCPYPWHWNANKTTCIERPRWIDTAHNLEAFLRSRGYTESHCPQRGNPPPGSVKIWDLAGGIGAHSSIVLSQNRQIEMGSTRDSQGTLVAAIRQGDPQANVGIYQLQKVLCPPPGTYFDEARAKKLAGLPRYGEKAGSEDDWNCHGFSGNLVRTSVETFVRVRPDTNVNWDQVLEIGAIHGTAALTIRTPQGVWHFKSEYTIEVQADGETVVHLIEGQADYQGSGQAVSLSSGEMVTVAADGRPGVPAHFSSREIDAWWEDLEAARLPISLFGWATVVAGLGALGLLAVATFLVVRHRTKRRQPARQGKPAPRLSPLKRHRQPWPVSPTEPWGSLSVIRGQAHPQVLKLDRPVVTLGRSASSEVVLADGLVSRRHAQIRRQGDAATIHDLDSTHGTLVNGQCITGPFPLRAGDVVTLGRTQLVWETAARDRSPTGQGRLSVVSGRSEPSSLKLSRTSSVSIGRSRKTDIVIQDDVHVSRRHTQIECTRDGCEILDLRSTNGLYLNGRRISQARLRSGDRIRLSNTEFVYED